MKSNTVKILAMALAIAAASAHAEDIGQHPAVFSPRELPSVNPSTFIVGHPASPRFHGGHANFEHPAVQIAARAAATRAVDSNTFLVQPPATVSWTRGPAIDTPIALR